MSYAFNPFSGRLDYYVSSSTLDDGTNKILVNGTTWEFWINNVRVGILDENGNLRIKGVVITEDVDV